MHKIINAHQIYYQYLYMLISTGQIIDTELVLLSPAQRSQASFVSILLGRISKNLNKCSESLTFLLSACVVWLWLSTTHKIQRLLSTLHTRCEHLRTWINALSHSNFCSVHVWLWIILRLLSTVKWLIACLDVIPKAFISCFFIFTSSNKRPQALSLIIRTCVYFEILFDIYLDRSIRLWHDSNAYDTLWDEFIHGSHQYTWKY